jgi:hypothetical protein
VGGYESIRGRKNKPDPKRVRFDMQMINFGDGTGFESSAGVFLTAPPRRSSREQPPGNASGGCQPPTRAANPPPKFFRASYLSEPASLLRVDFLEPKPIPPPRRPGRATANGFNALSSFDNMCRGGNGDGVIDAGDAVFASLRLWRDTNHDGVSGPGKLHTLESLDAARIHLDYKESRRTDEHGNRFLYRAKVDGARGAKAGRWAWDVFLVSGP